MNYYKISTVFLGLIIIVLISLYFTRNTSITNFELKTIQTDLEVEKYLQDKSFGTYDDSNNRVGGIDADKTGRFIDLDLARQKYSRFIHRDTLPPNSITEATAFAFGFNKLKNFVDAIIKERTRSGSSGNEAIQGIRAYLVLTPYEEDTTRFYYDLMLLPVRGNSTDYRQVKPSNKVLSSDSLILNTSSPCPNNCDPS